MKYCATYFLDPIGDYTPNQTINNPAPGTPLYEPRYFAANDMQDAYQIAKDWFIANPPSPFGSPMKAKEILIIARSETGMQFQKFAF
jgi:hypothetical protein